MKHQVGITKNNRTVYVDLIHSKAAKHISSQPQLLVLVKEALGSYSPTKDLVELEHNMGRSVGYDFTVATTEKDIVFYAQLLKSSVFTPFLKNGIPLNTQSLSLILEKSGPDEYMLLDAWVGVMSPALPGSDNESTLSKEYWANHAIVYTNQAIQTRTLTKTSPY